MRDLISLALRFSVVCVVAERWLDVFDAITCVSAFDTACNKWLNMNWDFFIIKKVRVVERSDEVPILVLVSIC